MPIIIEAGTREYALSRPLDQTIIAVDVGFASSAKSTGIAVYRGDTIKTRNGRFGEAPAVIASHAAEGDLILILEAPLTMAFDRHGNPAGRSIEKRGSQTRYWYCGLATSVLMASVLMLRKLHDLHPTTASAIHLYEGFVTFKTSRSEHHGDARQLIEALREKKPECLVDAADLKKSPTDELRSTLPLAGWDELLPAVVVPEPESESA